MAKIAMNYLQTALSPTMQPMVPQPQTFGSSPMLIPMQGMPQQIMMVMPQPGLSQLVMFFLVLLLFAEFVAASLPVCRDQTREREEER